MVKITGLTALNIRALRETQPDNLTLTATTAEWPFLDAAQALRQLDDTMSRLPVRGHPRASLHAVRRKLVRQLPPPSGLTSMLRLDQ